MSHPFYQFINTTPAFRSKEAANHRTVYFPICGATGHSIKSSITPFLSGDIKTDKHHYLTKPVSVEDLRCDLRNFFVYVDDKDVYSFSRRGPQTEALVEAGQLWHKLTCTHKDAGIEMQALNFVPVSGENVELMRVSVKNTGSKPTTFTPTASVPLFCRALENKHDHEHVTSLLNRVEVVENGIIVTPTMHFNEEGHKPNQDRYFVVGFTGDGNRPAGVFPTSESFYGDSGHAGAPQAVFENHSPSVLPSEKVHGHEAVGALRFKPASLKPGETKEFFVIIGTVSGEEDTQDCFARFDSSEKFDAAFQEVESFWQEKSSAVTVQTNDKDFDAWMQWVTIQPVLRRIFGCSFLPDHDYGKGGRGWRDLWQDLLSLILIEPKLVRNDLLNNFAGVRIDGSNATIIGSKPGEFIADRNRITRVWMDHGVWPLSTVLLYFNQTGDFDFLLEEQVYFKDPQASRTCARDDKWVPKYGNQLKTDDGKIYKGTVIEHLLVQHLVQFFNVGEHNVMRLESADWNDGLDMAFERGESVAFMSFYGGNFMALADLLETLAEAKKIEEIKVAKELLILLDNISGEPCDYENWEEKAKLLSEGYFDSIQPEISGEQQQVKIKDIVNDLRKKGEWIFDHLRKNEKVSAGKNTWFNGYYDNKGNRVEGQIGGRVRMTLTGQVFPVMSGLADDNDVKQIMASVDKYLKNEQGGVRLNTDFGLPHYLDLGRAFGFAYGTKENGAVFSHMVVMYAYALYSRGFAKEGFAVLNALYQMSADSRAKIYPGIPEYFDLEGRGRYHFLTGAASWLVLTELTQAFGVRGKNGDLCLNPKLVKEQFDADGRASVACHFAGKQIVVTYENKQHKNYGAYTVSSVKLNDADLNVSKVSDTEVTIARTGLEGADGEVHINVTLA